MPPTILDLRDFYQSPLGHTALGFLQKRVATLWSDMSNESLAALGYGTPLLRPWLGQAHRLVALTPRELGVAFWPPEGPNICCFADLTALPLPDESMDRVLILHALESSPEPAEILRETWRVLKNGGRALLIVPNRRGLWALSDETPFGHGQPFSTTQMKTLARAQGFSILRAAHCLYAPPWSNRIALALAPVIEKIAGWFCGRLSGLLILEIEKQVLIPVLTKAVKVKPRPAFAPLPSRPLATRK